jgi:hypothetical protein
MKGLITKLATGVCLGLVVTTLAGCVHYRNLVDVCWFERYNSMARHSVRDMFFAQEDKGHMLDQTIWNWMFESDDKGGATARLNAAGIEQLKYISRRLPVPDGHLYIQNAQDVRFSDAVAPEKLVQQRNDLNNRRIQAIQNFMATQIFTHGGGWQVAVHDFAPPGLSQNPIVGTQSPPMLIQGALPKLENNFQGIMPVVSGTGSSGGSGASSGGGAGGR